MSIVGSSSSTSKEIGDNSGACGISGCGVTSNIQIVIIDLVSQLIANQEGRLVPLQLLLRQSHHLGEPLLDPVLVTHRNHLLPLYPIHLSRLVGLNHWNYSLKRFFSLRLKKR